MGNELTVAQKNMVSVLTAAPLGDLIKPLSKDILLFDTYIAGTSHVSDKAVFTDVKAGDKLILRREPDNRFDENAILVLDEKERKLGYVPEKDNLVFARLMDAGKFLSAKVTSADAMGSFHEIEIDIYMTDF